MSNFSRYLDVIYCDDIRNEVGNKLSYMGVYTRELNIPSAPLILPKLCIAVKVVTGIDDPFESVSVSIVKIKDHKETEIISSGAIPLLPDINLPERDNDTICMLFQMQFVLSPFQIDENTILKVKATTEREELHGTALRIQVIPPSAPSSIH